MANDHIPRPDARFHAWQNNLVTYDNGHLSGLGLAARVMGAEILSRVASEAGLSSWSGQIGAIHGERGRFRLSREFSCGGMMIENPVSGESRLNRAVRLGTIAA